ncbi:MAG: response regulator [Lachnospiraceae bacterium]|nr:response regulator [Lachnospiraceae bacterium]
MYKIMIADDEGIVIEALKFIIEKSIEEPCMIESAKTGRQVIELSERFRPDIAFMDIQMPGISGIKAMQEIRRSNRDIIFIVISAYEKFDYAKDAIRLGVLEYLNKPIVKDRVVDVLHKAIAQVEGNRRKRQNELEIQEKLETVIPIIENGMIYSVLFQEELAEERENYCNLLGLKERYGYMIVICFGDSSQRGRLTNAIGSSVKAQPVYGNLREVVKEYTGGIVGAMMGNHIIAFVPKEKAGDEYEERIAVIDRMREMIRRMKTHVGVEFRVGIGGNRDINHLPESYQEAMEALRISDGSVAHVEDLPIGCRYEQDYPIDTEKQLFAAVENGDRNTAVEAANAFFKWMLENAGDGEEDIRLKVLEFVMWAEKIAYESGGMTYRFRARHTYLDEVLGAQSMEQLRQWFEEKIGLSSDNVRARKKESAHDIIDRAKQYIEEHYRSVSLNSISRDMNISPYYFSKLFKEKTGDNFIDYITDYKIAKAKEQIKENKKSMKEICVEIGYANPNYFSYIFKKKVGVTPTEYREGLEL